MKTTNQIFIDDNGKRMTREWYVKRVRGQAVQRMRVIPTHKSQIRPDRISCLWRADEPDEPKAGTRTPASQFLIDGIRR